MPYLKPSSASKGIVVEAADVNSSLTLTAPATVKVGETFMATGQLTRDDTGAAVQGGTVTLKYNGATIGSAVTDTQGAYIINGVINTVGSYTLEASFPGMNVAGLTLAPSFATSPTRIVAAAEIPLPLLALAALVVIGLTQK